MSHKVSLTLNEPTPPYNQHSTYVHYPVHDDYNHSPTLITAIINIQFTRQLSRHVISVEFSLITHVTVSPNNK